MGNRAMQRQLVRLQEQVCEVIATAQLLDKAEDERHAQVKARLRHIVESGRVANRYATLASDWQVIEGGKVDSEPLRAA